MADKNFKDNVIAEVLKYKPVKHLIVALLSLLCASVVFSAIHHFHRCSQNLNSKLFWGMDECLECKTVQIDSVTKHDTIKINVPVLGTALKAKHVKSPTTAKQENKSGANEYFDNKAPNNGIEGGQGNSQNFYGSVQPHPDAVTIGAIEKQFPDKNSPFEIMYPSSSHMSVVYASELHGLLLKAGYKTINMVVDLSGTFHPKMITPFSDVPGVYVQAE